MKTIKEFNDKYKDFLEDGHYGLAIEKSNVRYEQKIYG
jgi:hypothetical protein